jgi:hypothetical protein
MRLSEVRAVSLGVSIDGIPEEVLPSRHDLLGTERRLYSVALVAVHGDDVCRLSRLPRPLGAI